jgi:tRNA threonylcarbamoyladenosine biosynthesis protein TsaE
MTSVIDEAAMLAIGKRLGAHFRGGEVIELIGDVGAGKTTLVKGMGQGLHIDDDVQSPSFTISRVYQARNNLELHHYDFYRLEDAGVMRYELAESMAEPNAITVVEWAGTVQDVLPDAHTVIKIDYTSDGNGRVMHVTTPEPFAYLQEGV